jgi:hypothetical protein
MTDGPDTAGFADAQDRLRQALGVDAVFLLPGQQTWPPDTPLDPESGRPYDPFVEPDVDTGTVEVTLRCSWVHRPFADLDPAMMPAGFADRGDAALIVPLVRYVEVKTAKRVRVGEDTWDVQAFRYDVSLTVPRWIAYLERA